MVSVFIERRVLFANPRDSTKIDCFPLEAF